MLESRLLMSSQAVGVLVVQIVWTLDAATRLFFARHLVGGTEYMFDPAIPILLRLFSLFHVFVPAILVWGVWRLGYDKRGIWLQSAITCVALALAYFFTDPAENINWVRRPFGLEQRLVPPIVWMLACMILYPLALYYPTHRMLARLFNRIQG